MSLLSSPACPQKAFRWPSANRKKCYYSPSLLIAHADGIDSTSPSPEKTKILAPPRRSARLQELCSSSASAIKSVQTIPPSGPLTTSPVDLPQPSGQKPAQYSTDEPPVKRRRKDSPSVKDVWSLLRQESLQTHNRLSCSIAILRYDF